MKEKSILDEVSAYCFGADPFEGIFIKLLRFSQNPEKRGGIFSLRALEISCVKNNVTLGGNWM